ncbi:hypothetical protein BDY17DRAFT_294558 [Neohortaea acidophila]|uniref:Uncharacterized protein n=1 Tax=Neohortaea acidophila TaxID=245834 RepID=A0A6A6PUT2_9PEZI|nr:uncharacterized protein BDY17DRAFT_294558 [Neohortaea acidophila]KAF2483860.1 hypothetical protein BDY17DRAFT_294558 [Neohortaea acidophila]
MPPKKAKAKAALAAAQPVSASQPEPQRATRAATRKRRHSDTSNISEASTILTKTPAKRGRPRKGKAPASQQLDATTIEEEEDKVMDEAASKSPVCEGIAGSQTNDATTDTIQVSQSSAKQVHFGSDAGEDDENMEPSATNITPHPRKMAIKRRRSDSPIVAGSVKRVKSSRTSLPHALSLDEPTQIIQEHSFAPLRAVLDERIRRLSTLRDGITQREIDMQFDGTTDTPHDDDMLVLNAQDEFEVMQFPNAPHTPLMNGTDKYASRKSVTPGAYDRSQWAAERKQFHDAIEALEREANEATSQLRILNIELESLDFAAEGAPSRDVLQSIRESFAQAREFLETELPGSLPENASSKDLVDHLVANVQEFAERLRTADGELGSKGELVNELGGQINGLLDRLANKEINELQMRDESAKLTMAVRSKDTIIADLQEDVRANDADRDDAEKERDSETARAGQLEAEKSELEKNVERLSISLREYQDAENKLTKRINDMEDEHRRTVTAMNVEREETVRDLEDRLDSEVKGRKEADELNDRHQEKITGLEAHINGIDAERDELQQKLDAVTAERDEQHEKRDTVETELEEKDAEIEDLALRVRRLDDELDGYQEELDQLRQLAEAERQQREAAEKALDESNESVESLTGKLHDQGKQANELRQKLFEVQTEHDRQVKELKDAASGRDVQFQEEMAGEVQSREEAEALAQERAANIDELQRQLSKVEGEMRQTLAERDAELTILKDQLEQQGVEIQKLRDALHSAEDEKDAQAEEDETHIQTLEDNITTLRQTIDRHEDTVANLQQQATDTAREHQSQIDERNAQIESLDYEITELKLVRDDLEKDKTELERKVQDEAEFLLVFQNEKNAEVDELKLAIKDKQDKIHAVETKVRNADRRWQDLLSARDEEIAALAATNGKHTRTIESIGRKFGDYVRRSSHFIARLQEQVDAAKVIVEEEGEGLEDDGKELLEELMLMEVPSGAEAEGKRGRARGRKRTVDSAIGLASSPTHGGAEGLMS